MQVLVLTGHELVYRLRRVRAGLLHSIYRVLKYLLKPGGSGRLRDFADRSYGSD
jgi:hypothetical protein